MDPTFLIAVIAALLLGALIGVAFPVLSSRWTQYRFTPVRAALVGLPYPVIAADDPVPPAARGHEHTFHQVFGWAQNGHQRDLMWCECGAFMRIQHRDLCVH